MRPKLDLMESENEVDMSITIKSYIRNSGLGPAIFVSGVITFRGKVYHCSREGDMRLLVEASMPKDVQYELTRHETKSPGFMMIMREEHCLAEVVLLGVTGDDLRAFKEAKKEMKIEVVYRSLYDEEFRMTE